MEKTDFHTLPPNSAAEILKTNINKGLSNSESKKRLEKNGPNEIQKTKHHGIIYKFLCQFKDFMVIILMIAAALSFVVSYTSVGEKDYIDSIIILAIVIFNGIIGTVQEYQAEKAIDSLKNVSAPTAQVIRDGKQITIDSRNLVVGDVVMLKTGDICPADGRIVDSVDLSCEESSLTGESVATEKESAHLCKKDDVISARKNMVFSGCGVASGHGKILVTEIGNNTQIGLIAQMLENEEAPETPLQKKLNHTGKLLGIGVVVICIAIFVLGIFRNAQPVEMLMISTSLAVAAIPEGLTAVVTIVLALGVKRMARRKAIVRKLPAVETLGSTSVICSDKTGTLTENKMTVAKVSSTQNFLEINTEERRFILFLSYLCNNSEISAKGKSIGSPTEVALKRAYLKEGRDIGEEFTRIGEIPFSSSRKMMTTVHRVGEDYLVISKGTPNVILNKCATVLENGKCVEMTVGRKSRILELNREMGEAALRVIAVAKKEVFELSGNDSEFEDNLCFCGLVGIEDPPRKESAESVALCKKAGITPVMITGDQPITAMEIAKRIGIWDRNAKTMTGAELKKISQDELSKNIESYRVFSGVSPEDKVKIVRAFQKGGRTVAMTGDGINDAPALKSADIGCAMGKNGTEVAKNAADMVLTDDNFATIVSAIKEGRNIFINIRKTIHFLLSCNMGEILVVFVAFLLGMPAPLLATQLLWVNFVTDSIPALALGVGRCEDEIMGKSFLEECKDIFSGKMWTEIIIEGAFIGSLSLLAFVLGRNFFDSNIYEPVIGRTMSFAVLCFSQIVHSFNISVSDSVFKKHKHPNKWLKRGAVVCTMLMVAVIVIPQLSFIFKTTALSLVQWLIVAALSLFPLIVSEIEKLLTNDFSSGKK